MANVQTSRSRTGRIDFFGEFGQDPDTQVFINPQYPCGVVIRYWGTLVQVFGECFLEFAPGVSTANLVRVGLRLWRNSASITVYSPQFPCGGAGFLNAHFISADGSFTGHETCDLVRWCENVPRFPESVRTEPIGYEQRNVTDFQMAGTLSATVFTDHGNFTASLSTSLTYADTPGVYSPLRGSSAQWQGLFDYGHSFNYSQVGFHKSIRATASWNVASLDSSRGTFTTTKGFYQLAGTQNDATFRWTGNDTTDVYYHVIGFSGTYTPGQATMRCSPSWAISVSAFLYRYKDGTAINAPIEHHWRDLNLHPTNDRLITTFTAPGPYRYPASGLKHDVFTNVVDGFFTGGDFTHPPGVLTGAVTDGCPLFHASETIQTSVGSMTFEPGRAWADGLPTYLRSKHARGANGDALLASVCPRFPQGTLAFDAPHRFKLFEDHTRWKVFSDAGFLAANAGYTGSGVTLADSTPTGADGNALKVSVTTAKVLVTTRGAATTYNLKHQAYRNGKLRVQGPSGGQMKIGIGTLLTGGGAAWGPAYAWDVTLDSSGTWNLPTRDLLFPQYATSGAGAALAYNANTHPVHPAQFMPEPLPLGAQEGADVWLEIGTAGDWYFDWLEGSQDASAGHTAALLLAPLDGAGDTADLLAYENGSLPGTPDFREWRLVTNGAHGFDLDFSALSAGTFWDRLISRLGDAANDTGIQAVKDTGGFLAFPQLFQGDLSESRLVQPFGKLLTPGAPSTVWGQLRSRWLEGYPGQGDTLQASEPDTSVATVTLEWVFGGEVSGVLEQYSPVGGVLVEAHDNDTGAVLGSSAADLDAHYRAFAPYGARLPIGNVSQAAEYSAGPVYTVVGKGLNSHWLGGTGVANEDSGGYLQSGGSRVNIAVMDRFATLLDLAYQAHVAGGVSNLAIGWGFYWSTWAKDGNIQVRRADRGHPPFDMVAVITNLGIDSEPCLVDDADGGLFLLFTRSGTDVYWCRCAGNDGASFSMPTILFPGGTHPRGCREPDTPRIFHAAYVAGKLQLRIQPSPESAPGAAFIAQMGGADIQLEDDSFGLYFLHDEEHRLNLDARLLGEAGPSSLWSASDGATFTRYP